MPSSNRKIIILDTTLRDGDQSPGFALRADEKVIMAGHLEKLGVDIIEAGFPASSPGQFAAVQRVAESLKTSGVSAMARANRDDIKKAGEAIRNARQRYIHTSISTSPVHRRMKLRKSRSEIIKIAVDAVQYASEYADYVEIGAEDATRTEPEFLSEFCVMVTDAGADVVNIADTVGYIQPSEFYLLIRKLLEEVKAFRTGKARISVHCHNDLGLAVSNTLSGLSAGAMQAEVTLLGIGERGGNTPLEELAAALITRRDYYGGIRSSLDMKGFAEAASVLSIFTGMSIPANKPVAGKNAFSHSSGIHQNGMLASPLTYSLLSPVDFGLPRHRIVFSRHSGMSGLKARIRDLTGDRILMTDDTLMLNKFKLLADSKKDISATEILTTLFKEGRISSSIWYLNSCVYSVLNSGKSMYSIAVEVLSIGGEYKKSEASGATKWDAAISALNNLFSIHLNIISYSFSGAGGAAGNAESFFVTAEYEEVIYSDESYGDDAILLFIGSYLNIINQISAKYQLTAL
jgi:2-isopropylmalate synthase